MNERIKELAEQAEEYAYSVVIGGCECHEAYTKKFAELIVRECIDIVDAQWEPVLVEKIREHFGVKE